MPALLGKSHFENVNVYFLDQRDRQKTKNKRITMHGHKSKRQSTNLR